MKKVIVIGAGGTSREVAEAVALLHRQGAAMEMLGFLDDDASKHGQTVEGVPVLGPLTAAADYPKAWFVLGIASYKRPTLRDELQVKVGVPDERYLTVVHPSAYVSPHARLGPGCVILHNAILNPGVVLGPHVNINQGCCIGHDTTIGRNSVVAPNGTISGYCRIGESAYIGCNASLAPEITLGDRALVGIGSVVVQPVEADTTVFGCPARVLNVGQVGRWTPTAR